MRLVTAATTVGIVVALVAPAGAFGALGSLLQLPGTGACVAETTLAGLCVDGRGLGNAGSIATSPDGRFVYASAATGDAVSAFRRDAANGALTQLPGTDGCVSETGGECVDGVALDGPTSVAMSPDGGSVYTAALTSGAVAAFDRNPDTGKLTQLPGTDACVSASGTGGLCVVGVGLLSARHVAVSPDSEFVYVTAIGSDAITIFDRNRDTGKLTQLPGTDGCIADIASPGCADGEALINPVGIALSPLGDSLYVAAAGSNAVTSFERGAATGKLTQLVGPDACISEAGGTCRDGKALMSPIIPAVDPGGKNVYVASQSSDGIAILRRDSAGRLTQSGGPDGCVTDTGTGGACANGREQFDTVGLALSHDGRSLYAAGGDNHAVTIFDRDPATGNLAQQAGTAGCVSDSGSGGACVNGVALDLPFLPAVSRDDKNVYVASQGTSDAIAVFTRAPSPSPLPAPKPDTVAPVISGLKARPRALRTSTTFSYRLSEPARVGFTLQRVRPGRRVGKKCKAPTRRNRSRRRCKRYKRVGGFTQTGKQGANKRKFSGKVRGRRLARGSYRVVAVATDSARNRSKSRSAGFTVKPRRRR